MHELFYHVNARWQHTGVKVELQCRNRQMAGTTAFHKSCRRWH